MQRSDATAGAIARLCGPLFVALASSLLMLTPPGEGVGFLAGLGVGSAFIVHALAFGVTVERAVFSPLTFRLALALSIILFSGGSLAGPAWTPRVQEAAAFLATSASMSLAMLTLFGRVPTLRDEPW